MKKKQALPEKTETPAVLKGWQQIAGYLGHPPAVVQRWAAEGMPVRKQGRYVETTPQELNQWLGQQSGKPVHFATAETDLTAELKRGLSFVRAEHVRAEQRPKIASADKKTTRR